MEVQIGGLTIKAESVNEVRDLEKHSRYLSIRVPADVDVDRIMAEFEAGPAVEVRVLEDDGTTRKAYENIQPSRITSSMFQGGQMCTITLSLT